MNGLVPVTMVSRGTQTGATDTDPISVAPPKPVAATKPDMVSIGTQTEKPATYRASEK